MFDSVASQYSAARPGCPAALYDAVEELTGRPIKGSRVVDVGAGTGIATRVLRDRGAHIVAVEPGHAIAGELRRALPGVPLLRAVGDALPLADGTADLLTYAQAWHWTDPARSVPEAFRVLARPHGALALWWNVPDPDTSWTRAQEARLADRLPGYHAHTVTTSGRPHHPRPRPGARARSPQTPLEPARVRRRPPRQPRQPPHPPMLGTNHCLDAHPTPEHYSSHDE
ncbi:class I SAM-dependent methyltransferase [Streptomyces sp. NPDC001514]